MISLFGCEEVGFFSQVMGKGESSLRSVVESVDCLLSDITFSLHNTQRGFYLPIYQLSFGLQASFEIQQS